MRVELWSSVAELKLSVARKVGEAWRAVVQSSGRHVHSESAHLTGSSEEWTSTHAGQLFHSPLLGPFVLEPDLKRKIEKEKILG